MILGDSWTLILSSAYLIFFSLRCSFHYLNQMHKRETKDQTEEATDLCYHCQEGIAGPEKLTTILFSIFIFFLKKPYLVVVT